jgi:hypothetical protein
MKKCKFLYSINEGLDPTLGVASYMVQGQGPGYVYNIRPLYHGLEQKANDVKDEYYIHVGSKVCGTGHNNPSKHYTGIVTRIVKNSKGEIEFLYIKTIKNNKFVTIDVNDELKLIVHKSKSKQISTPNVMNPSNDMRI